MISHMPPTPAAAGPSRGDDTASGSTSSSTPKKAAASCKRCRVRKIKCDDTIGRCGPCRKAGVECIEVSRGGQDVHRSLTSELASRIIWLEGILTQRCPDVSLSDGPGLGLVTTRILNDEQDWLSTQEPHETTRSFHPPNPTSSTSSPHSGAATTGISFSMAGKRARVESMPPPPSPLATSTESGLRTSSTSTPTPEHEDISHEVGLVSLAGSSEARYVGPSSGFSFAKLLRAALQVNLDRPIPTDAFASSATLTPVQSKLQLDPSPAARLAQLRRRLADQMPPDAFSMPSLEEASILVDIFFSDVHYQFPCLHQSTFTAEVERTYSETLFNSAAESLQLDAQYTLFKVFLVLAIGLRATQDRSAFNVSPVAMFERAQTHLDKIMSRTSSVERTQCLILVAIYSLYSPAAPNVWTLSYHLMANCVDLGLQRKLRHSELANPLDADLRKRLFWTVYSLDRILSVALGRPLSLRDEAFDVPFPSNLDESEAQHSLLSFAPVDPTRNTSMTPSIRLFELYQIFSEIKLNIYRVCREPDRFPWPSDLDQFRRTTLHSLHAWRVRAQASSSRTVVRAMLDVRYHQAVTLLFRPSPAFPVASIEALEHCQSSAKEMIHILDRLQRMGRLPCTFLLVHDSLLAGLTILFCHLVLPSNNQVSILSGIRSCSSILTALGHVWAEARKARNVFDKLSDLVLSVGSRNEGVSSVVPSSFNQPMIDTSRLSGPTDDFSWLSDPDASTGLLNWDLGLGIDLTQDTLGQTSAIDSVWNLSTNDALQEMLGSFNAQFAEVQDRGADN